jgi:hypothetical protein
MVPTALQFVPARGHRWLVLLTSGEVASLREIAIRDGVNNSYVSRTVNLTTLAPNIVAGVLDDALPNHITLFGLAVDPPVLWEEQRGRGEELVADAVGSSTAVAALRVRWKPTPFGKASALREARLSNRALPPALRASFPRRPACADSRPTRD